MSSRHAEYSDAAKKKLSDQGFKLPPKPKEEPEVLADITDMDDTQLMEQFALLTAWADYAFTQLAVASIEEREAERCVAVAEAGHWRHMRETKSSVSALKATVALDDDVLEAQDELDEVFAYKKLLGELAARYERDAAVLSRELTRRTSFAPHSRRDKFTA